MTMDIEQQGLETQNNFRRKKNGNYPLKVNDFGPTLNSRRFKRKVTPNITRIVLEILLFQFRSISIFRKENLEVRFGTR